MNTISSHNLILHKLHQDVVKTIESEKKPYHERYNGEFPKITLSIAALDLGIIARIDHLIDFGVYVYRGSPKLNTPITTYKFTPLHVAAISGNDRAAKQLLEAGAHIEAKDSRNWTALHHAAANCDIQMIQCLLAKGASKTARTAQGGTYQDILNLAYPTTTDPNETIGLFWRDEGGNKTQLTRRQFKEITQADYTDEIRFSSNFLPQEYANPTQSDELFPFSEIVRQNYREFVSSVHILSKVTCDSSGNRLSASPGLGLYASHPMNPLSIVGEYKGFLDHEAAHSRYALGLIDSLNFRNEIPQINDGFPNTGLIHVENSNGVGDRYVLVATNAIEQGEQFCWNYGIQSTKFGPYVELRPRETREFIQTHDLTTLQHLLLLRGHHKPISFEQYGIAEKFRYITETPPALFAMIFDGTINQTKALELKEFMIVREAIPLDLSIADSLVPTALECVQIKKKLLKISPQTSVAYQKYFTDLPSRIGIEHVVSIAKQTNQFLSKGIKNIQGFDPGNKSHVKEINETFYETWKKLQEKNDQAIDKHLLKRRAK